MQTHTRTHACTCMHTHIRFVLSCLCMHVAMCVYACNTVCMLCLHVCMTVARVVILLMRRMVMLTKTLKM